MGVKKKVGIGSAGVGGSPGGRDLTEAGWSCLGWLVREGGWLVLGPGLGWLAWAGRPGLAGPSDLKQKWTAFSWMANMGRISLMGGGRGPSEITKQPEAAPKDT